MAAARHHHSRLASSDAHHHRMRGVEDEMDAADTHGVGVLDMFEAIMRMKHSSLNISEQESAFVDKVHVKCSVNRELLSLILAAICGSHHPPIGHVASEG